MNVHYFSYYFRYILVINVTNLLHIYVYSGSHNNIGYIHFQ